MCFKLCNSRKCCISIWATWYAFLIVFLHAFLIKDHVKDILNLRKAFDEDSNTVRVHYLWWEHESSSSTIDNKEVIQYPSIQINLKEEYIARIILTCFSVFFLILFFLTSMKKIGNFSNDGVKLGRDFFCEKLHHHHRHYTHDTKLESNIKLKQDTESLESDTISSETSDNTKNKKFSKFFFNTLSLIWRHFLPVSSVLHLLSILTLLIQDLIYEPTDLILNDLNSIQNSTCPGTRNMTQCFIDIFLKYKTETSGEFTFEKSYIYEKFLEFKFEIVSIGLAYLTLSIRYGAVFWYTNKTLSYLISLVGLICTIEQLFQLYIFIYISKQIIFAKLSNLITAKLNLQSVNFGIFNITLIIDDEYKLILLYSFLSLAVLLSLIPIYSFSYLKYKERFFLEETLFVRTILEDTREKAKKRKASVISLNKLDKANFLDHKIERHLSVTSSINLVNQNRNCFNYCPHLIATLQLVLICALKLPFSYDLIIYFNNYKDFVLMLAIINEILHTIILLFIWLILTLKTEWQMHLRTSFSICHWTYHLKLCEKNDFEVDKENLKCAENSEENEFFNSESLYRNEIRKSSRNILRNTASVVPAYVRPENRLNRISQPAYLTSSTPSTQRYHSQTIEIPIVSSPNLVYKNLNQNVPSSAQTQATKQILYLKRDSANEYESRV
ncbi:unnamed protein product [Brachionus calyciflorus]|uniref:Uncharacterized protein n=1 Tax=Brachionus calyciflorus TaxID=104777 RepID=A0A813R7P7_9BILA|nr:unnamed protein product [Brachionus calyciflorus]